MDISYPNYEEKEWSQRSLDLQKAADCYEAFTKLLDEPAELPLQVSGVLEMRRRMLVVAVCKKLFECFDSPASERQVVTKTIRAEILVLRSKPFSLAEKDVLPTQVFAKALSLLKKPAAA